MLDYGRDSQPNEGRAAPSAFPTGEAVLDGVLDDCRDIVVLTDAAGRVVHVNRVFRDDLGESIRAGRSLTDPAALAVWGGGRREFERDVQRLGARPEECGGGEVHRMTDGRVYAWRSRPLRDAGGAVVGRSFVFQDLSQDRELAALKSDFLSTVTHELRTPLTSVKGSLQLVLGKSTALAAVDRELLGISLKNADRLIRLINDLLDISRLELGKLDLTFRTIAVGPLVEEAVAGLRAYAGGRDIAIGCEIASDLPPLRADRDRLIQVLTNLISNAVKFSPAGGRVLVSATAGDDGVAIAVRDWGVGIPASDQGRLFRRFQRLNPDYSTEPGTGLGLAISKAIVDRHGGRIVVASRADEGSTFTMVVPAVRDVEAAPVGAIDRTRGRRATVLLVDDDVDLGTVLELSLGERYRLLRVERGVQALDVARAERPDLVLLDVVLPDLSGYDVLRILQHSAATGDIPIVILTVQPEPELASALGATAVLAKPIDIDALRELIERILGARSFVTA